MLGSIPASEDNFWKRAINCKISASCMYFCIVSLSLDMTAFINSCENGNVGWVSDCATR